MKKNYKAPKSVVVYLDTESLLANSPGSGDQIPMGPDNQDASAKSRLFSSDDDDWGINIVDMN